MRRRCQQQHVALFISDQSLKELEPLMSASLATYTGMRLVDDHQRRAGPRELIASAVCLDIVKADDRMGISLKQALSGGESAFEGTSAGRSNGDHVDIELLGQFTYPLLDE